MTNAKRTGTLEGPFRDAVGQYWAGKIRLADGTRTRVLIPEAKRRSETAARNYLAWAQEQEDATHAHYKAKVAARDAALAVAPPSTLAEPWVSAWSENRHAGKLASARDADSHWAHHLRATLGAAHPRDWTAEHGRAAVRHLDGEVRAGRLHWKTAINIWATATKMSADACESKLDALRVRDDDPFRRVAGPDEGSPRSKQFLYPSEFLRFVSCRDVPIGWRLAVTQAIYLYPRDGEHRVLRHADVDLDHGVVNIARAWDRRAREIKSTKSGEARRFNVEPELVPLLRALRTADLGALLAQLPSERDMARGLRRWLKRAGVDRPELHTTTATTKAITWHDLRATGITWMAIRGDAPQAIMQRAGHADYATTNRYVRDALAIREGFGRVFPPLPPSLYPGHKSEAAEGVTPSTASISRPPDRDPVRETGQGAEFLSDYCGADGTRTRGLRRDRPAL